MRKSLGDVHVFKWVDAASPAFPSDTIRLHAVVFIFMPPSISNHPDWIECQLECIYNNTFSTHTWYVYLTRSGTHAHAVYCSTRWRRHRRRRRRGAQSATEETKREKNNNSGGITCSYSTKRSASVCAIERPHNIMFYICYINTHTHTHMYVGSIVTSRVVNKQHCAPGVLVAASDSA